MKVQDILFFVFLAVLLFMRKPKLLIGAGIACFVLSMPLFAMWVFFTAERLVWYGVAFILLGTILLLFKKDSPLSHS